MSRLQGTDTGVDSDFNGYGVITFGFDLVFIASTAGVQCWHAPAAQSAPAMGLGDSQLPLRL